MSQEEFDGEIKNYQLQLDSLFEESAALHKSIQDQLKNLALNRNNGENK